LTSLLQQLLEKAAEDGPLAYGTITRVFDFSRYEGERHELIVAGNGQSRHLWVGEGNVIWREWLDPIYRVNELSQDELIVAYGYSLGLNSREIEEAEGWPRGRANGHGMQALTKLGLPNREALTPTS
jgi:hypothetical protein